MVPRSLKALHTGGPFSRKGLALRPQTPGSKAFARSPLHWAPVGSAEAQGRVWPGVPLPHGVSSGLCSPPHKDGPETRRSSTVSREEGTARS